MRLIFLLLLLINIALLFWRFGLGLPEQYQGGGPVSGVPAKDPPLPGRKLQLLSESTPTESAGRAQEATIARAPMCKMVGPFDTEQAANILIERLSVLDVAAQVHPVELSSGKGHWVYFPAQSSREAARQRLAQLQSRGVDSYIIPKGDLKNGISLGVFSEKALADARVAELQAMGYAPKVQIIDRSYEEIWVMLPPGEEQKIGGSTWQKLIYVDFSLQEQENLCLDVASR